MEIRLFLKPLLLILSTLLTVASAQIEFIAPQAGAVRKGGSTITVEWRYSVDQSLLYDFALYDLFLCAGGNGDGSYDQLAQVVRERSVTEGNSVSIFIDARIGESYPNAYFLQMVATTPDDIVIIHSNRFSLSDMTGSFSPQVKNGLETLSNTDSPPVHHELSRRQAAGSFTVPYGDQTGPTRYAPMVQQPPTKISLKSAAPLFPTSAYNVVKTHLPIPTVLTTMTAQNTFNVASIENTASPAPAVDAAMQKFLNRWKD